MLPVLVLLALVPRGIKSGTSEALPGAQARADWLDAPAPASAASSAMTNPLIRQQQHWRADAPPREDRSDNPGLNAVLRPRYRTHALRVAALIALPPAALMLGCVLLRLLRRAARKSNGSGKGDDNSDEEYDPLPYTSVTWNGVRVSVPRERRGLGVATSTEEEAGDQAWSSPSQYGLGGLEGECEMPVVGRSTGNAALRC